MEGGVRWQEGDSGRKDGNSSFCQERKRLMSILTHLGLPVKLHNAPYVSQNVFPILHIHCRELEVCRLYVQSKQLCEDM